MSGCFAQDTIIALPGDMKAIQLITTGESVMAAKATLEDGRLKLNWGVSRVNFSSGVSGTSPPMAYVAYGEHDRPVELICSLNQVFMRADGKLIRARHLQVGDWLADRNGRPVPIQKMAIDSFKGGAHDIGTANPGSAAITPDDHLLLAGGVVAGDYHLQLFFDALAPEWKAEDLHLRAKIGSAE